MLTTALVVIAVERSAYRCDVAAVAAEMKATAPILFLSRGADLAPGLALLTDQSCSCFFSLFKIFTGASLYTTITF